MSLRGGAFQTARLRVRSWHDTDLAGEALPDFIVRLLTPRVIAPLPPAWHGTYTRARAQRWIADRDREGTMLPWEGKTSCRPAILVVQAAQHRATA